MTMLWSSLLMVLVVLLNLYSTLAETKMTRTKPNWFDPVLSSNGYVGHIKENERLVQLEPRLYASDADLINSPNGKICGYELSRHKHDDSIETTPNLPFIVEFNNEQAVIKLKSDIEKIDCEIKQTYRLFIRAYDCADINQRRYSERSSLIITVDDVNEYPPVFTHKSYLFKLHQDQVCSSCRVEATDDDCLNSNHRVCDYQIRTPNVPFGIDSNGSISITKPLNGDKYEFDVVAIDCYPSSSIENIKLISEPARVTIKIIKSCKPKVTDENPAKLTIQSDHTHIFDTVHVDTCDETCAVEDIVSTVTLDSDGIDSGCNLEQCAFDDHEYVIIPKDVDYNQAPQTHYTSFDGINQALLVRKKDFSGQLKTQFAIHRNRHHAALFIHDGHLKLLIRKGPVSSSDKNVYSSEWIWQLSQLKDGQWHSYKLFVDYPNKIDLYVDNQLFVPNDDNYRVVDDFALPIIEETGDTVFSVGACWHGRASRMVQHFHGQLSGLLIEQKEELPRSTACTQNCQQYLDMPDIQKESGFEFVSNFNRSVWTLRSDSSESMEQLLKHIVYRNTLEPIGPSGQRTVSIETAIKCLGENYTYNLPTFSRRLSIDEKIRPTNIELKGDTNFHLKEETLDQGIYLFRNLSIFTDALKKDQVDISDCSINTSPDFSSGEKFIIPDENLEINNIRKDLTQTGLVLSGFGSIDTYQFILQQILFLSKSPIKYVDRTFSLICIGAQEQISTNEIRIEIHVEKQVQRSAPVAAALSNKLYVDNDPIKENLFDIDDSAETVGKLTAWPIAIGICISVSIASVLILYLVVRIRSANKQRNTLSNPGDDMHSQMEWEDDIGLNIIVNPLDETKKSVPTMNVPNMEQVMDMDEYEGTSSEEDENDECDDHSHNDYSSEEDDTYETNQIHAKKRHHQLEWDDEALEYGPKKV
ncbi:hypothetical protein I4U23_024520 [Adineta vaga]|nr:hypothetical protein I4U23_024520 [Adineta vaga]